jgi:hypothetical protein
MANHPDLARRWMVFANPVLAKSTLPERDRQKLKAARVVPQQET